MHLFDVDTLPNGISYRESDSVARGEEVVTYRFGERTVGCAICYDIRFPELFRALRDKGADVIVLPAAFTLMTGKDHWEVLARARAVETQTYFLAVGQIAPMRTGKKACWGIRWSSTPGATSSRSAPTVSETAGADLDFFLFGQGARKRAGSKTSRPLIGRNPMFIVTSHARPDRRRHHRAS